MTERYRFFDAASYIEADFAEVLARLRRDGVLEDKLNKLAVTLGSGLVTVDTGEAFIQGFWYQNTAALNLAVAPNGSASPRIDYVVLHLYRAANTIGLQIHQGVVGAGAPALTQIAGGDWEIALATLTTTSGVTTLVDSRSYSQAVYDGSEINAASATSVGNPNTKVLSYDPSTKLLTWAQPAASQPNGFDNSAMRVNQRGATSLAASGYICDRWQTNQAGTHFATDLLASTPTASQLGTNYVYSTLQRYISGAVAAGEYSTVLQVLEGYDWQQFHGNYFNVSWWAWSSVAANFAVSVRNAAADRSFVHVYSMPAATWAWNWFAVPPVSGGTWTFTSAAGALVAFSVAVGSTYSTGTYDQWVNGNFLGANSAPNPFTVNGQGLYTSAPKIEPGPVPTRLILPDITSDLKRCYRQLFILPVGGGYSGGQYGTGTINLNCDLPVPMRDNPTFTQVGMNSIANGTSAGANQVAFLNRRIINYLTGGTLSSASLWWQNPFRPVVRIVSSTAFTNGAAGDTVEVHIGNGVQVILSAEI